MSRVVGIDGAVTAAPGDAGVRCSPARTGRQGERGAAAVLAVTLAAALLVCAAGGAVAGRLLVDHRRAAVAADLAALAGAAAVQRGLAGCAAAERVAVANDAGLTRCRVVEDEVRLVARTDSVRLLGRLVRPQAEARAGPVG